MLKEMITVSKARNEIYNVNKIWITLSLTLFSISQNNEALGKAGDYGYNSISDPCHLKIIINNNKLYKQ